MNPHVLILSGLYDFSADLVALRLEEAGVPFLRLNREHLHEHRLCLDPVRRVLDVTGPSGRHQVGPELRSIWYRQPVFLRNTPAEPLLPRDQLERSQWSAFLRALSVFRDAAWMNFPAKTYLAESKPYQLSIAKCCGFQVPKTLVTNDAAITRQVFPGEAVLKSLDTVLLHDGTDCLFTYTTIRSTEGLADRNMAAVPLMAQQVLGEKTDIRVTIIGETVFAVRILSGGAGIEGDWRVLPRDQIEYEGMKLDENVADSCRSLAQQLGLSFAAIDLIETTDGIFFIEVNPTGEWGWLSTDERPIDRAISAWLAKPPESGGN